MAATDASVSLAPAARRAGLRREIGFIGLLWASTGSIIGSGWLFGAQGALATAGPAAVISWVIGGVAILLLALVHAELGAMYPVAGGTARFPHIAFGGAAGASFGWFSWLQAVTVAPIEVMAVIQYARHYSFASGWQKLSGGQQVLTGSGLVVAIVLMAIFTAINFLGVRKLAQTNSAATWWKVAIPVLAILALGLTHFHSSNFIAAVISPGGTGLIYTTASSRVSYGLSRNGYVPSVYERTNLQGIPWVGLITAFVVGCICFLPFPSWRSLVGLITSASVLMYAGAPLAVGVFRSRLPEAERPYRLPAAAVLAPLSFVVANLLILWSGWTTDYKLGIAILIGYVILAANRLLGLNPVTPLLQWRAAAWLPVYLVGMGLIVYLSDFGPLKNPVFPLWWDMVAVAIFSLGIYAWAQRVALPADAIERLVATVPDEEAPMDRPEPGDPPYDRRDDPPAPSR